MPQGSFSVLTLVCGGNLLVFFEGELGLMLPATIPKNCTKDTSSGDIAPNLNILYVHIRNLEMKDTARIYSLGKRDEVVDKRSCITIGFVEEIH
jgi:hypothetical protein